MRVHAGMVPVDDTSKGRDRASTVGSTVAVLLLTLVVAAVATVMWRTYFTYQPLWVEHAAYGISANIHFHDALVTGGYLRAFQQALGTRHVLQPAVLGLFSPALLAWPYSHLLMTVGTLFLFLALLMRFVRARTESTYLALSAAVLFCAMSGLYDERSGVGAPWPDFQAMFLLGAAMLSFGLYALSATVGWLALAGGCVSLGVLARDTAGVYAGVVCFPALVVLLLKDLRDGRHMRGVIWRGLVCGSAALPGILLLLSKIDFLRQYYMTANVSQLRQPLSVAVASIWQLLFSFTGAMPLIAATLLVVGGLAVWPRRERSIADVIVLWWPLSFLLLLLANGYTSDVTKEVMYIAPGLVCAAATMGGGVDMQRRGAPLAVSIVLAVCVVTSAAGVAQAYNRARHPDDSAASLRVSQRALAGALASIPQRVMWHSYSRYDWGTVLAALTFYEFGRHQPTENRWFHNRKNYWDANFPGMELPRLEEHIFAQAEQHVDVAIVLRDPDVIPEGMEEYSYSIAAYVARHVQSSSNWRHYRDVQTSVSGPLSLYVNLRRVGPSSFAGGANRITP